tara:strand:- start:544 stop:1578 length:1035 start_codon:yes stop_codon:yes gene_type:complete
MIDNFRLNKNFWKDKTIFISGGTGTFGKNFLRLIIENKILFKKLIIFSRDELKQSELSKIYPITKFKFLRYFIGDIRDRDRLDIALKGVDIVFHAAALKQVDTAEYNPTECIKTNIYGSENIITSSIKNEVKKVIALSTDKACSPINLYGATKLAAEKLFISANVFNAHNTKFSVLRYGNVSASRGSVIPLFIDHLKAGNDFLPITDERMTRFWIDIKEAVFMAMDLSINMVGGETIIPRIPSFKITDLAKAMDKNSKIKIIGIRPGEKIHEEMVGAHESLKTYKGPKYYYIMPEFLIKKKNIIKNLKLKKVKSGFNYSSNENKFLDNKELLAKLIKLRNDTIF